MQRWLLRQFIPNPILRWVITLLLATGLGRRFVRRRLVHGLRGRFEQLLTRAAGRHVSRRVAKSPAADYVFDDIVSPSIDRMLHTGARA